MESRWEAANTYYLVIMRRRASEVLLLSNPSALELPSVAIHPQRRIAEQLTTEVKRIWRLETYCLSFLAATQRAGRRCAVMECVRQNEKAPAGTCWTPRASAADCAKTQEGQLIREALEEFDAYVNQDNAGPFAKPGWLRELVHWTREQLAPRGRRLTGGFRQLNASPTFSLVRLETYDGAVWFKAAGEPNSHELSVTLALARLFPQFIPCVLGVHSAWNGWLAAEAPGVSLDEFADWGAWEQTAAALAELQIASIGETADLLQARLKDLRIPRLAEQISPFVARMGELMAVQEKRAPAPLAESELRTLAEGLKEGCSMLESLGLPETLGHLDFNAGNILVTRDRCVFLDWAEGCVTNPFVIFEYLCEHLGRSGIKAGAARERLASAYLRPWTSFHSPAVLRRALALSPLIAVFAYAVAADTWHSLDLIHDSLLAGSFRSLTRRMYREAIGAAVGSEVCLD